MADLMTMGLSGDFEEQMDAFGDKVKQLLRPGGTAAASVFQKEAKLRAPFYTGSRKTSKKGKAPPKPGQLRDAIYQVYAAESTADNAIYEVSWNHSKATHGHWMEHGNSRMAARPFIRPAYEAVKEAAIKRGIDRMAEKFKEIT